MQCANTNIRKKRFLRIQICFIPDLHSLIEASTCMLESMKIWCPCQKIYNIIQNLAYVLGLAKNRKNKKVYSEPDEGRDMTTDVTVSQSVDGYADKY